MYRALIALTAVTILAQNNSTIAGRTTDSSGLPAPGVRVEALHLVTQTKTVSVTDKNGLYVFPVLSPGRYRLVFRKDGFREATVEPVILSTGGTIRTDAELTPGTVDSRVEVRGSLTPLEQESASVGTVIDRSLVENIPLNGRSFHSLMRLVPGVTLAEASVVSTGQFVVNGMRSSSNYFMVDGVGANFAASPSATFTQQASGSLPGLTILGGFNGLLTADAVEEFRVQTSGYAAEFGRTPGGQIQMTSRTGSSQIRGSLSHYFRNEALDANDWFANANNQRRAPLRLNQFAGSVGGPLTSKTFFHFSYEGLRLRQPRFLDALVPSSETRQSATGAMREIFNAFPLANTPSLPGDIAGTARYRQNISFPNQHDIPALRIDHTLTSKVQLFGRVNHAPSSFVSRSGSNFLTTNYSTNTMITGGATAKISSSLVNELRANFSRSEAGFNWDIAQVDGAVRPPDSLLFPSYANPATSSANVSLGPAGAGMSFTVGRAIGNLQRQLNVLNNLSWVSRSHQMKFGFDFRRMFPQPRFRAYGIGYQFPSLASSLNTTQVQLLAPPGDVNLDNYSFFAQDTWRLARRFTLTFGLRYEVVPPPNPSADRPIYRISQITDLLTATIAPAGTPLYKTSWNNFAPRVGVAWQPWAKSDLTIRAGTGLFYDLPGGQALAGFNFWPYNTVRRTMNNPFPAPAATLESIPVSTNPPYNDDFRFYDPNLKLPYAWHWNFGVEKSLGSGQTLSMNYVGSAGRRLIFPEFYRNAPGQAVINPIFTTSFVRIHRNLSFSNYNSLQIQLQRRLQRGLQALVSYTWSKALDSLSDETVTAAPAAVLSPSYFYGPSDFDIRQTLNGAVSWQIPMKAAQPWIRALGKDWAIDGIVSLRTAAPITVITGDDPFNIGLTSVLRPNPTGQPFYLDSSTYPGGRILNRNAFASPVRGQLGALGRNTLRAFPLRQVDLGIRRSFALYKERTTLQFRAEFFNVTNTPNFGDPSGNLLGATFGRSTAMLGRALGTGGTSGGFNPIFQIGGPRSIQFSLRLNF
jgi:hypothetical protein